jgi:transposase-like protein
VSTDPRGRRLSKPEKEAILSDIRQRSASFQTLAKKHRVSISTVSRLAAENGLSSPRKRTPAVEVPEHSYDRKQRKAVLDRMLHSIDKMVERGGLSSRQLKDLASAVKEVNASRSSLDTIPDPRETSFKRNRGEGTYDELLGVKANGAPKHLGFYFGVLDIETAGRGRR